MNRSTEGGASRRWQRAVKRRLRLVLQLRACLMLFSLALVVRLAVASLLPGPPYVDAYFYTVGGWRLAQGYGFTVPFIWHYLDLPSGVPRPGFLYWMPLPAMLVTSSIVLLLPLLGRLFLVAQIPFAILSALLPVLSYQVAWRVAGVRRHAWAAGLITIFSGFFFPFWTLPETFAPFAILGCLALWLAGRSLERKEEGAHISLGVGLLIGLLVGLAHLTRADGLLLLPVVALVPVLSWLLRNGEHRPRVTLGALRPILGYLAPVFLGYLLAMAPWFARNLSTVGVLLSPAGTKTIWLRTYDDIACFGCDLSFRSYVAWGWRNILDSKLSALWINIQRFLAEDCLVFLSPFAVVGFGRLRRRLPFLLALIYLVALYLAHSLIFTLPGWRGAFFHSSGVLLPFLFAAAMEGLDVVVGWAGRRRRYWNLQQAQKVFTVGMVIAAVALSLYAASKTLPAWWGADAAYMEIGVWLDMQSVPSDAIVMVNNPPGFYYHTGMPCVAVPNGGVEMLSAVAERYQVTYIVLDRNRSEGLADLYAGAVVAGLELLASFDNGEVQLYRWTGSP
jgi:hypothetical protein